MTIVALALLSLPAMVRADDLVAIVDLEFVRATDRPAALMCDENGADCHVWATLNLYKASIRKVLDGVESRKTMFVLFGRHAVREMDLPGVIATMRRLDAEQERDPQYQIMDWGQKRELFCFSRREGDSRGFELRKQGEDSLTCYDAAEKEP